MPTPDALATTAYVILGAIGVVGLTVLFVASVKGVARQYGARERDCEADGTVHDAAIDAIADDVPPSEGLRRRVLCRRYPWLAERMGWERVR